MNTIKGKILPKQGPRQFVGAARTISIAVLVNLKGEPREASFKKMSRNRLKTGRQWGPCNGGNGILTRTRGGGKEGRLMSTKIACGMTALLAAFLVLWMDRPTWELMSGPQRIDRAPKPLSRRGFCFLGIRSGCVVSHRPKTINRRCRGRRMMLRWGARPGGGSFEWPEKILSVF